MPLINLLKIGVDTRKYFRIESNLLDILEDAESCRFNMQNIVFELDFVTVSKKTERYTFFICLFDTM